MLTKLWKTRNIRFGMIIAQILHYINNYPLLDEYNDHPFLDENVRSINIQKWNLTIPGRQDS